MVTPSSEHTRFSISALRCAAGTDVGMRREENQDSFGIIKAEAFHAYLVADGMGGAQGGATASRMAISGLREMLIRPGFRVGPTEVSEIVKRVNRQIYEKGSKEPAFAGMGTTLVGLFFTNEGVLEINVGDSRAYRIRDNAILQISEDHTLVRELVRSGAIAAEEAQHHPVSHMLTRSLGPVAEVQLECRVLPDIPQAGDVYILCSDGLYNFVSEVDILSVVKRNPLDDANQILINLANQRGGSDNITVLVISVGDAASRDRASSDKETVSDAEVQGEAISARALKPSSVRANGDDGPPLVEEPKDPKFAREALRQRRKQAPRASRPLPLYFLVGVAMFVGLTLGDFARRLLSQVESSASSSLTRILGPTAKESSDRMLQEGQLDSVESNRSSENRENPLSQLARQMRSESAQGTGGEGSQSPRTQAQIEQAIDKLQAQIRSLSLPAGSDGPTMFAKARERVALLEREYAALDARISAASRAVTLWLGRQVNFESDEAFNSSIELEKVAAYSDSVKGKLASIAALSYQYRERADEVELHPGDEKLRTALESLSVRREQLKRDLRNDVRKTVGASLARSYKEYETLRDQRDRLFVNLQEAKEDMEVARGVVDPDPVKRESVRQSLEKRLREEQSALSQMR